MGKRKKKDGKELSTGLTLFGIICTYELSTRLASIATPYMKDIRYTLSSNSTSIHLDVVVRALLPAGHELNKSNCAIAAGQSATPFFQQKLERGGVNGVLVSVSSHFSLSFFLSRLASTVVVVVVNRTTLSQLSKNNLQKNKD